MPLTIDTTTKARRARGAIVIEHERVPFDDPTLDVRSLGSAGAGEEPYAFPVRMLLDSDESPH